MNTEISNGIFLATLRYDTDYEWHKFYMSEIREGRRNKFPMKVTSLLSSFQIQPQLVKYTSVCGHILRNRRNDVQKRREKGGWAFSCTRVKYKVIPVKSRRAITRLRYQSSMTHGVLPENYVASRYLLPTVCRRGKSKEALFANERTGRAEFY